MKDKDIEFGLYFTIPNDDGSYQTYFEPIEKGSEMYYKIYAPHHETYLWKDKQTKEKKD